MINLKQIINTLLVILLLPSLSLAERNLPEMKRYQEVGIQSIFIHKSPPTGTWSAISIIPDQDILSLIYILNNFSPDAGYFEKFCFHDVHTFTEIFCTNLRKNRMEFKWYEDFPSQLRDFTYEETNRFKTFYNSLKVTDREAYIKKYLKIRIPADPVPPPSCDSAHITGRLALNSNFGSNGQMGVYLTELDASKSPFKVTSNSFGFHITHVDNFSKMYRGMKAYDRVGVNIKPYNPDNAAVTQVSRVLQMFPCHIPETIRSGYVLGDADKNGRVDYVDRNILNNYLNDPKKPYLKPLDINRDGKIDLTDLEPWAILYTMQSRENAHVFVPDFTK